MINMSIELVIVGDVCSIFVNFSEVQLVWIYWSDNELSFSIGFVQWETIWFLILEIKKLVCSLMKPTFFFSVQTNIVFSARQILLDSSKEVKNCKFTFSLCR